MKRKIIDVPQIRGAMEELLNYQRAKSPFLARVENEEQFYRLRVAPTAHSNSEGERFAPTSAWLLNSILQKHADLMEYIPTAACLAREPGDVEDAKALSQILPVILERSNFEDTYSDNMWFKLKHGVCAYGVFWNNELENGLGDVDVRRVDMRNLYWQPGVRDIQHSRSVYFVEQLDTEAVQARFPHYDGSQADLGGMLPIEGDQVLVVDWYYKKRTPEGRTVLHYCKFAGDCVLFSSENEEGYENGWYEHGEYPFVLDVLYPIEGESVGFGMIALARDPQVYIDRMDRNLLEYMDWATRVRFFCKKSTGVDEQEFADLSRLIVGVEGDLDEERLRQICVADPDPFWLNLKNAKVNELKETTASRDILQGIPDGGVTAASAIAALQEAGSKTARDSIAGSYRAYEEICFLVICLIGQFYTIPRCFRIMGADRAMEFLYCSGNDLSKDFSSLPAYDLKIHAHKQSAFSRASANELALELYRLGVFNPEYAPQAEIMLSLMEFEVKDKTLATIRENGRRLSAAKEALV